MRLIIDCAALAEAGVLERQRKLSTHPGGADLFRYVSPWKEAK